MYESFYGLKEKPFTLLPDPEYLYLSPKHQRALTLLEYGLMNQAGFSVICGDTGAGKTTLIRRLLSELEDNTTVGLITNTHESFGELLNWVLMAFGLDGEGKSKAQMHQMFIEFLIEQYARNQHSVLIVDEAQNMKADTLEELRMLSNINADKDQVLQVILAGQPALRETLRQPELMQFAQRIAVDYYLEALSKEETRAYIQHRLHVAGSDKEIFSDDACKAIYKYSGGTPRLINLLCDTSLVYGFAEQCELIEAQLVHDVVREQHSNSIIPTFNTNQPHATDNLEKPVAPAPEPEPAKQPAPESPAAVEEPAPVINQAPVKPVAAEVKPDTVSPAVEKAEAADDLIADLAQRAVSAVNHEDEAATKQRTSKSEEPVEASLEEKAGKESVEEGPAASVSSDETVSTESHQKKDDVAPYMTHRHHKDEEVYPIVHIEEPPKKGVSMMLIGLVSGMFIASILMMAFAWVMLNNKEDVSQVSSTENTISAEREAEKLRFEALQKERDAALAVTRALERERDAAITAAKAQEKIRAAELRASEILAEQEVKAEARLREARARARQAEIAEAKALERERALKLKAQQMAAKQEAKRLEALKIERARLEAQKQALTTVKPVSPVTEKKVVDTIKPSETTVKTEKTAQVAKEKEKESKKFSANPCNSPSAKFLSTCKR